MIVPVYDSTHANIARLPPGRAAGYVTGSGGIAWTAADWHAHPDAVRIAQSPSLAADEAGAAADVLDVEAMAATLADCAPWAKAAQKSFTAGTRPGQREPAIYTSAGQVTAVVNALTGGGVVNGVNLWVADWNLDDAQATGDVLHRSGPFPIVGVQWKSLEFYDVSVFASAWLDAVSSPPGPSGPFPSGRHLTGHEPGTMEQLARRQHCDVPDILWATAAGLPVPGTRLRKYVAAGNWKARMEPGMELMLP